MFSTCVPLRLWGDCSALTLYSQTELLMNTHAVVSGLEHRVRDIHRTIVGGQGGNGDNNSPVSDSPVL